MGFGDDLQSFATKVDGRLRDVFVGAVGDVHESITEGSEVTGAPGQPVDEGNLIGSWQPTFPEDLVGQVATGVEYARSIEEGQQPPYTTERGTEVTPRAMVFRSEIGGAHSVRMTRVNWDRIVEDATRRAKAGT
jgi:hypothetical protein